MIMPFKPRHAEFPFLESFEFRRSRDCGGDSFLAWQLTLVLGPPLGSESRRRWELRFGDVRDLTIGAWLQASVMLQIMITDVRDHQLDGIRYKVREDEIDAFSFYCAHIEEDEIELPAEVAAPLSER